MKIWLWITILFIKLVKIEKKKNWWDYPKNIITHNVWNPRLVLVLKTKEKKIED